MRQASQQNAIPRTITLQKGQNVGASEAGWNYIQWQQEQAATEELETIKADLAEGERVLARERQLLKDAEYALKHKQNKNFA